MKIIAAFSATLAILLAGYPTHSLGAPTHRAYAYVRAPLPGAPAARRQAVASARTAGGEHSADDGGRRAAGAPSRHDAAPTPRPTATARPKPTATAHPKTATGGHGIVHPPARPVATATPRPTPAPKKTGLTQAQYGASHRPYSWMAQTTLLTIYGRAFDTAPILGRLGMDDSFAQMDWQIQPYARGIKANNGGTDPRIVVHLIYAMAVPCYQTANCLYYLDDAGVDIVKDYIKEAARRHWLVILDDQLGRSDPATEMKRIIDKGYLQYDNVEVALDPEFRTAADQPTPGIPVGTVSAAELNSAGAMLNAYAAHRNLLHRKIMMVHQFREDMITDRQTLRQDLFYVDTVIVADGFGSPGLKAHIYDELLGADNAPAIHWRGIKLFLFNPYEQAQHGDYPEMTWPQVFGRAPAVDPNDGGTYYVRPIPNVVVIA